MGKKEFDFWQDHSINYLEMAFDSQRHEIIEKADGYAKKKGDCGDSIQLYLVVENDTVTRVTFLLEGCMNTNACANAVATLAEGNSIENAWNITPEMVIEYLKTLPMENYHCAELVVGALYLALANYHQLKRNNWKKLFAR